MKASVSKASRDIVRLRASAYRSQPAFRSAIDRAIELGEERMSNRLRCPAPRCKKANALASITFRGIRAGKICRFCHHVEMLASSS